MCVREIASFIAVSGTGTSLCFVTKLSVHVSACCVNEAPILDERDAVPRADLIVMVLEITRHILAEAFKPAPFPYKAGDLVLCLGLFTVDGVHQVGGKVCSALLLQVPCAHLDEAFAQARGVPVLRVLELAVDTRTTLSVPATLCLRREV